MRPLKLSALMLLALSGCGDSAPVESPSEVLSFEVFHAGIEGLADSFPRERVAALPDLLTTSAPDVLCLQGVWRPADRAMVAQAVRSIYPHVLDLPDRAGPAGDQPPCADPDDREQLDRALECLHRYCGSEDDIAAAGVTSETCVDVVGEPCQLELESPDEHERCEHCLRVQWRTGATFQQAATRCKNQPGNPLGHDGEHGLMLLSRHALRAPSSRLLPSEGIQRAVISATVAHPSAEIDVHCATLGAQGPGSLPRDALTAHPYPGDGYSAQTGWEAEHDAQVAELLEAVKAGGRTTVVLVNTSTSAELIAPDGPPLSSVGPAQLQRLEDGLELAIAPGFTPRCTVCPENILELWDFAPPPWTWLNRVYLHGAERVSVLESFRTRIGRVVPVDPSALLDGLTGLGQPPPKTLPASRQYGFRVTLEVEPR